ncbi:phosphoglycolate phosphatase [Nitrosophilus kaiyonis]|uniref:phosphoglycolate phosphatase n=1 Tax=Nitrosophilus kaiyonis TaxID=2930200 RepID=UPI00249047C2|nr:phosphoglycolate phosphatase [Nitrosophilus kaiyonis]
MFYNKNIIIFDLDGTLIDSALDLADSVNFMLKKLNREPFSEDIIRSWIGNGAQILVKRALCGKKDYENVDEKIFKEALEIFLEYYEKNLTNRTTLYPDVKETLEILKEKDKKLSIATNKPTRFIEPILEYFDMKRYFDIYLGGDSVQRKKPDPQMLIKICDFFKVKNQNTLMVGDSINDKLAAKNANIDFLALTYGYNDEDLGKFKIDEFKKIGELV